MTKHEHEVESDLIDIGAASVETKGLPVGYDFDQIGQKRDTPGLSND